MAEMNATGFEILDEDDMISDSATAIVTQQSAKAYNDGLNGGAYDLLSAVSITGSPTEITFLNLDTTYFLYELYLCGVTVSSDSFIAMQLSTNNGSSWRSSASDYSIANSCASGQESDPSRNGMRICTLEDVGGSTLGFSGFLYIGRPADASYDTQFSVESAYYDTGTNGFTFGLNACSRTNNEANNAFRLFLNSTYTFEDGKLFLYGVRA